MNTLIDVQIACDTDQQGYSVPNDDLLQHWADSALTALDISDKEVTLRFVDADESQSLNLTYRGKDKPTNVLSFPFECPPDIPLNLLGDLVICVPVIHQEAAEQRKKVNDHFAHMIVHGILHLLGYDHIDNEEAETMERLETSILAQLGIDDPYQEL
ncbi:rRNA maturation RNase YbeY [Alteromonas sp. C1M14]|uniref:rRNA maturation RNase YbeY n=1 Tax=Alteromonas sp. C1M14 TaxID=2841567 RepID=UPI001C088DBF|nr:rRNA maturation RNase YbeY [Alteromonas sp. C1M14]